ncbi:MAG TPA: choice-of-anchor X domain-containing protein [Gammaproteobacteria bacterium]|nr:choice-of-anchor X domain-containing protein [Gammaproteobacteria bacterium]
MKTRTIIALLSFFAATVAQAARIALLDDAPFPVPGAAGPAHHSRLHAGEVEVRGGKAILALPVETPQGAVLLFLDDDTVNVRVPAGPSIPRKLYREETLQRMGLPAAGVRFELSGIMPGVHALDITSNRREGRLRYVLAEPGSALDMVVRVTPLAVRAGETVRIEADLSSGMPRVANVMARLEDGRSMRLRDDGRGGDRHARDGVYTAVFAAPAVAGHAAVLARLEARGTTAAGRAFARTASAAVMVTAPRTRIEPAGVRAWDDALEIPLAAAAGRFRVAAVYGRDTRALVQVSEDVVLNGAAAVVTLPRPPAAHAADRAVVRVLNLDNLGLEAERLVSLRPLLADIPDSQPRQPAALPASKAAAAERFGTAGMMR